jgi:hypothetical protein
MKFTFDVAKSDRCWGIQENPSPSKRWG